MRRVWRDDGGGNDAQMRNKVSEGAKGTAGQLSMDLEAKSIRERCMRVAPIVRAIREGGCNIWVK